MKLKRNLKTNIVERYNSYHKIVNVKNQTVFRKKYGALEHGLGKCLEIFFNTEFKGGSKKLFNTLNKKQFTDKKKSRYSDHIIKNEKNINILKKKLLGIIKLYE